jgi:hypothetical protein
MGIIDNGFCIEENITIMQNSFFYRNTLPHEAKGKRKNPIKSPVQIELRAIRQLRKRRRSFITVQGPTVRSIELIKIVFHFLRNADTPATGAGGRRLKWEPARSTLWLHRASLNSKPHRASTSEEQALPAVFLAATP